MRNITMYAFLMLFLFATTFYSCKEDSGVDWAGITKNPPTMQLITAKIHTNPDRSIQIKATVNDEVGIKSINLKDTEWFLDRTIDLDRDSIKKAYNLDYLFKIPTNAPMKEHIVTITVTNMGGKTFSQDVKVYMDGDFVAPVLLFDGIISDGAVLVPAPGDKFDFRFTVSDTRRLGYLVVKEAKLGLNDSIPNLEGKSYTYSNKSITIPQVKDKYNFLVTAMDSAGNKISAQIGVTVNVSWDFEKMYLCDVNTKDELNADFFGVPMLVDKTAAYTYQTIYFAEKANTPVKFLAQKGDFGPHCFGKDPANAAKLINSTANAQAIILPTVGYYKITFNTDPDKLTYKVEAFDPLADPNRPAFFETHTDVKPDNSEGTYIGPLGLVGKGFPDCPNMNWSPAEVANYPDLQLKQDATYKYRWTTTVALQGNVQFIIQPSHPWNWWPEPFWRFDRKNDPEKTILKGGNNVDMDVATKTTYVITFDQYLNRAKMVKKVTK